MDSDEQRLVDAYGNLSDLPEPRSAQEAEAVLGGAAVAALLLALDDEENVGEVSDTGRI